MIRTMVIANQLVSLVLQQERVRLARIQVQELTTVATRATKILTRTRALHLGTKLATLPKDY